LISLASAVALNLPHYQYGRMQSNFIRIFPILAWFTFSSGLFFFSLLKYRYGFHWKTFTATLFEHRMTLRLTALITIIFLLLILMMSLTGFGIEPDKHHWYEAGVPVLGIQIFAAGLTGLAALALKSKIGHWRSLSNRSDLIIFLLIWMVVGILWAAEPVRSSYFSPGPYLPGENFGPFSDATVFDLRAQFALIGQGLNNGNYFDRGLYPAFLLLLHLLGGQNYPLVMAIQAGILAVLPASLYLIGTVLHSRPLGIFVAVLTAAHGINYITSAYLINSSNQKMMMTDFPTGVILAIFTLWVIKWFTKPYSRLDYAVLSGAALGMASLIRTNVLFSLPIVLILAIFIYRHAWGRYFLAATLLTFAMLISVLPWSVRSVNVGASSIFSIYTGRVKMAEKSRMKSVASPQANTENGEQSPVAVSPLTKRIQKYTAFAPIAASHFLHNLVTSSLILPTEITFHDIENTVRGQAPFWNQFWDGSGLNLEMQVGIGLNLVILALGISTAWRTRKIAGMVPLLIFLGYAAANAMARTSGGRYIVPINWVILLYFALGLYQLGLWLLSIFQKQRSSSLDEDVQPVQTNETSRTPIKRQIVPIGLLFTGILALGLLIPLSESFFPRRYETLDPQALLTTIEDKQVVQAAGLNSADLQRFLQSENAIALNGRLLYPRYFYHNDGIVTTDRPYLKQEYPRLAFFIIGPQGSDGVILPLSTVPNLIESGKDVILFGCQERRVVQGLFLITLDEGERIYLREPPAPLQCPLPLPVCDDNRNCQ
jgi:hypothetical protein